MGPTGPGPEPTRFQGIRSRDPPPHDETLSGLRRERRLDAQGAAELCGVSLKTWQAWERENRAPRAVIELLSVYAGDLGAVNALMLSGLGMLGFPLNRKKMNSV